MSKFVHKSLSSDNARILVEGVRDGVPYREIGARYKPPVSGSAVYKHALKMGIVGNNPKFGTKKAPYSRNPA